MSDDLEEIKKLLLENKRELEALKRSRKPEASYMCDACGEKFGSEVNLCYHLCDNHPEWVAIESPESQQKRPGKASKIFKPFNTKDKFSGILVVGIAVIVLLVLLSIFL